MFKNSQYFQVLSSIHLLTVRTTPFKIFFRMILLDKNSVSINTYNTLSLCQLTMMMVDIDVAILSKILMEFIYKWN